MCCRWLRRLRNSDNLEFQPSFLYLIYSRQNRAFHFIDRGLATRPYLELPDALRDEHFEPADRWNPGFFSLANNRRIYRFCDEIIHKFYTFELLNRKE